jgi:O-antigen ligase
MTIAVVALLSITAFLLSFVFETWIIYIWVLLSTIYTLFPNASLAENLQQSIYGASSIGCLPAMLVASGRNIGRITKFVPFLGCILGLFIVVFIAHRRHLSHPIELLRFYGGISVFILISYLCYATALKKRAIARLLFFMTAAAFMVSGYGLVDLFFLHKFSIVVGKTMRAESAFINNANVLGSYCLFFFSVFLALSLDKSKAMYICLTAFFFLCIIFTFSNAAIAGMLVSCCVIAISYRIYRRPFILFSLVIGIILLLIVLFELKYIYSDRFHHVTTGGTFSARTEFIWPAALKLINRSPLVGYTPHTASFLLDKQVMRTSTHNEYLGMLLNYGAIGSFFVFAFFLFAFFRLLKVKLLVSSGIIKGIATGCLAYMFAYAVYGIAHSTGFGATVMFPFWFLSMSVIGFSDRVSSTVSVRPTQLNDS